MRRNRCFGDGAACRGYARRSPAPHVLAGPAAVGEGSVAPHPGVEVGVAAVWDQGALPVVVAGARADVDVVRALPEDLGDRLSRGAGTSPVERAVTVAVPGAPC